MENNSILQEKRRESIPNLIEKYQKLIDNIFDSVSKELPAFVDILDKDTEEVTVSSEQQLYAFINVRKQALSNANEMMQTINDLERELIDPNYKKSTNESVEKEDEVSNHPSKKRSRK